MFANNFYPGISMNNFTNFIRILYGLMCIQTQQDLFFLLKQKISFLRYAFHLT